MDKKSIASGVAAVALAATLAVTPAVTDFDEAESVEMVEDVVSEETIEDVTEEEEDVEEKETEETKTEAEEAEEEPSEAEGIEVLEPETGEHLEAEPPNYDDYITEIGYSFTQTGERSKTLIIDVPDFLSADIATMYVNGAEVSTALLPTDSRFTTIPVVFENLSNIEFKLYRMGEEIGSARFIGDILKTNAKAVE